MLSLLAAASLTALDFHPLPNTLSQIEALKRLYVSTNGASWEEKMNEGWMKVERGLGSERAWDGVECDPEMNVIGIELSTRGLRGALAPPAGARPALALRRPALPHSYGGPSMDGPRSCPDEHKLTHSPTQARCRPRW